MKRVSRAGGTLALLVLLGASHVGAPSDATTAVRTWADSAGVTDPELTTDPADVMLGAPPDSNDASNPDTTTAAADTSRLVTGTRFRFGGSVEMAQRYGEFALSRATGRRGEVARSGPGRWMGIDGTLTLFFLRGHLARVAFEADRPSPHEIDYAQDQLRLSGFRKTCETPGNCTWTGPSKVTVQASRTALSATVEPPPAARPKPKAPVVMVPDVLVIGRESAATRLPRPVVVTSPAPEYPPSAESDRVQGNVWVRALVSENGEVLSATVTRSIPELDAAAVKNAMRWRFEPYRMDGVPARFQVEFPVRFVLNF